MQSCYPEAISRVLKSEGGYVNLKSDPGGPTNFGITLAVYRANGHPGATAADIKAMLLSEAKRIYKARYADPVNFDDDPAGLDYAVLDYAVNSGVSRANKVLRRVIGLHDAAEFSQVLGQLSTRDPKAVIAAVNAERLKFLQGLKTWPTFGKGWTSRVQSVNAAALAMNKASGLAPVAVPPMPEPTPGKGEVPKPNITGKVVVGTGGGGAPAAGFAFDAFISAHPVWSALIAIGALIIVGVIVETAVRRWKARAQDAPTPGLVPVPELTH